MASAFFGQFTAQLRLDLQRPLPGEKAHRRMAVSNRYRTPMQPNTRTRKSAVLICFYPRNNQAFLPLILRPHYDGVHAGQMAFPGGRMERYDENLTRTALREAQEEVGISARDVEVLGQLTELFIPPSNFLVQPIVGVLPYRPDFYPDPREVEDVVEVSFTDITNPANKGIHRLDVQGEEVTAPFYQIENQRIWGATAMIISELLMVMQEADSAQNPDSAT